MKRLFLVSCLILSGTLFAETLATVGTEAITDKDVKAFIVDLKDNGFPAAFATETYALNKLIDFKVGIMEAKAQLLDQDPKAKDAMNSALYTYYLQKNVDSKYKNKGVSNKEIMSYYQKSPLTKIQRITYSFNKRLPGDAERAKAQMNLLRGEIKNKKITFEAALEKTKDKAITALTGTFDKVVINDLAPQEKIELKTLAPLEVSAVIQGGNFFAITRIVKVYPFSDEYSDSISERIRQEAIVSARDKLSKILRQKYAAVIKVKN